MTAPSSVSVGSAQCYDACTCRAAASMSFDDSCVCVCVVVWDVYAYHADLPKLPGR